MVAPARRSALLSLLALVGACLLGPAVHAQRTPLPSTASPFPTLPAGPARTPQAPGAVAALEGPVDPQTYVVGPGDVFAVSIGGSYSRTAEAVVSADGRLVIPEAGSFAVAGRTLASVRAEVGAALRRQFQNVTTDVALAAPRQFSVHVSGAVLFPGRHVVPAVGRVEDALAESMGDVSPRSLAAYTVPNSRESEPRPALRNVVVTGRDGAETRVDLMRYFATGDVAFNPTLTDGASIHLPMFDPARGGIAVSGAVDRPGVYDWRPDDTGAAVLAVAGGMEVAGRIAAVRRTRRSGGQTETVQVPIAEADGLSVEPQDQIFAVAMEPDAGLASAVGAVRFPGPYAITAGVTTLADLVEMAGGLAPDALVRGAYLERTARAEPEAPAPADPDVPGTGRPDSTTVDVARLSSLGLLSRRYLAQEFGRTIRLSLNPEAPLLGGESVRLLAGDRLVVPRDLGGVRVVGQVTRPGLVPYTPGGTASDYVALAGGLGPAAADVYVIDAGTGQLIAGAEVTVREGDVVFVDRTPVGDDPVYEGLSLQERQLAVQEAQGERQLALQERQIERQDQQDRRQARFQVLQTVVSVLGTAATLIVAYIAATNGNSN